jgi:hypothetical protein
MSDRLRCPQCNGSKIVIGAGYIEHQCDACNGNGYIVPNGKVGNVVIVDAPVVKPLEVKPSVEIAPKLDKRSKAYRESIGRK